MVPRRAEEAQNGARSGPKPPQEEPKKVKKANPNGKTKKGPNQDDPKTDLDPPRGRFADFSLTPRGSFGRPKRGQNGTEHDKKQNTQKESEKSRDKRSDPVVLLSFVVRSWAIWGRSWPLLGCSWPWKISDFLGWSWHVSVEYR